MRTIAAIALFAAAAPAFAQERALPFDKGWDLEGDRTAIVDADGRQVLQVETGYAHRRDVTLENGTIDFDVQLTRRRSFVYVNFRVAADGEREEFYLRPHKSGLPDSVQYAPVFQARSAWQLHHGPGGTAAIPFDPGIWTHVRVVIDGRRAAIFVKDMQTPALVVPRLARGPQAGYISLGGFLPANVPGEGPIARFSNVTVRTGTPSFDFDAAIKKGPPAAAAPAAPPSTIIRAWSVSKAFELKSGGGVALPAEDVTGAYTMLETEAGGMINLHRHIKVPPETRTSTAVARVTLRAERAGTYALDLGFSDIATVFINGTPIFRGDASYSFDNPRRDGLIGFDQARIYLPLNAGDNTLSVVVSDSFGGWGIMGRLAANGVTAR